jgi:hypothetical protein
MKEIPSIRRTALAAVAFGKCLAGLLAACLALAPGPSTAAVDHAIKLDHIGYRPGDVKVAIFTADPGATVEIRDTSDTTVFTVPDDGGQITSKGFDEPSGDTVWWVEFSAFATPGT